MNKKILLLNILFFAILSCNNRSSANFVKGPYLSMGADNSSMKVIWQSDKTPLASAISWGYSQQYELGKEVISENSADNYEHLFNYAIEGLNQDTKVYYKVTVDKNIYESSFFTAPPVSDTHATFYSYGDTRSLPANHEKVTSAILADIDSNGYQQSFLMHTGDVVNSGMEESAWNAEYFNRKYANTVSMLSKIPVMIAVGNHDLVALGVTDEERIPGDLVRKYWPHSFYQKQDSYYYSFDYGPLHFTVIDQYTKPYTEGSEQYNWIKNDIETTTKPWKIVAFHAPAWSALSDPNSIISGHGNNATAQALHPLLLANGVKLVVQGHNHYYARCTVDGIEYLTLGGGGAPIYPPDENYTNVVEAMGVLHFARFSANSDQIDVSIIDTTNNPLSTFSIAK